MTPPAAAAPAAPAVPPPVAPAPRPLPNPRDGEFVGSLGELVAQRSDLLSGLGREKTYATQDRDDSLKRLVKGRSDSLLGEKRGANTRGLFYSTFLTNRNRDVNLGYDDQQSGVNTTFKRGEDDRIQRQGEIERLYGKGGDDTGSEGARLLREAIERQIERDAAAAPPEPPVAAPAGRAAPSPRDQFLAAQAAALRRQRAAARRARRMGRR